MFVYISMVPDRLSVEPRQCTVKNFGIAELVEFEKFVSENGVQEPDYRGRTRFKVRRDGYVIIKSAALEKGGRYGVIEIDVFQEDINDSECHAWGAWFYDSQDDSFRVPLAFKHFYNDSNLLHVNHASSEVVISDLFEGDYGVRYGRYQYLIDPKSRTVVAEQELPDLPIKFVKGIGDKVYFEFSGHTVEAVLSEDSSLKDILISSTNGAVSVDGDNEKVLYAVNKNSKEHEYRLRTSIGTYGRTPSNIIEVVSGVRTEYKIPLPSEEEYKRIYPEQDYGLDDFSMSTHGFGGYHVVSSKMWFGTSFYNSEGEVSVSSIGNFDFEEMQYDVWYDKLFSPYSITALHVLGDDIWAAASVRSDEAEYPVAVLKLKYKKGGKIIFEPDYNIWGIGEYKGVLFFEADDGMYVLADRRLYRVLAAKDKEGKYKIYIQEIKKG
ncbi:MAG: hypothetical protein OEV59_06870 [Deltaproteobacteria bacterium]|nr:hypothetical protein [Deltaproteobacteria bacterium]